MYEKGRKNFPPFDFFISVRLFLLGVVDNYSLDGALTYGAELRRFVVAHTAYHRRAIHPLGHIATSFVHSDGVVLLALVGWLGGDWGALG